ncbi:MAG: hypothetical protein R3F19_20710 [Verrucomicrobiales bacterium]
MSEETYSFLCPSCSAHLSVPVSVAGVSGPCPYCASTITSPMPNEVPLEDLMAIEEAIANEASGAVANEDVPVPPQPVVERPYSSPPAAAYREPGVPEQQPWKAPAPDVSVTIIDPEPAPIPEPEPEQKSGRKKRGERVPKGKPKKRGDQKAEARPARREEAKPRPAQARGAVKQVAEPPKSGGMSLFAKACIGITGVALVALVAVYGLPMIMGSSKEGDLQGTASNGSEILTPGASLNTAAMAPNADPNGTVINARPNMPTTANGAADPANTPTIPVAPDSVPSSALPDPPSDTTPVAVGSTDTTLPESMTNYVPDKGSVLAGPRKALDDFLAAPNWKERVKYVTGGQALASEMKTYYTQYPDGPLQPVSINWTLEDKDPDGTEIFVFTTSFDVEENDGLIYLDFPTVVEGRKGKYTVNWHSFVEFKDRHLNQFVTKRTFNKPQNFHVIAVRSHYFDGDPELDAKLASGEYVCIRADSPNPDDGTLAFLDTNNKSCADMAAGLLWEKAAGGQFDTPLVELCWKKTSKGVAYVAVTKVLGDKWRDTPK